MKANLKRFVLLAVLAFSFSLLFANGKAESEPGADGAAKPKPISVLLWDRGRIPEGEGTPENNRWSNWVAEQVLAKLNLEVEWMPIPYNERKQKLTVMLAGGDAPDICYTYMDNIFMQFASDGGLADLGPSLEEYGPAVLELLGDTVSYGTFGNEILGIAGVRGYKGIDGWYVRGDLLEKYGVDEPETIQELYDFWVLIKENEEGIIPFYIPPNSIAHMGKAFVETFRGELGYEEAYVNYFQDVFNPHMPGVKEFLAFMNRAYNEGLIPEDFFTNPKRGDELWTAGQLATYRGNRFKYRNLAGVLMKNAPGATMVPIYPFRDASGRELNRFAPNLKEKWVFSPMENDNADGVVKYLNWMVEEGSFILSYGFEGEHHTIENGAPIIIDPTTFGKEVFKPSRITFFGNTLPLEQYIPSELSKLEPELRPGMEIIFKQHSKNIREIPFYPVIIEEEAEYGGQLIRLKEEFWPKAMIAEAGEFDAVWQEILNFWDENGGPELVARKQAVWDEFNK